GAVLFGFVPAPSGLIPSPLGALRFTAPRYKTQRLDSDVSAPPTERCCGRRDEAHAAYSLRSRVRRFTAPCYETQRFDSAVSSPPAERSRRRLLGSPVRTKT